MQDLGLHGDKELDDCVKILEQNQRKQIVDRIIKLDSVYYKYKYYKKDDEGLPVTCNYTILHEVEKNKHGEWVIKD